MMKKNKTKETKGSFIQEQIVDLEKEKEQIEKELQMGKEKYATNILSDVNDMSNITLDDGYFQKVMEKIDADRILEQEEMEKQKQKYEKDADEEKKEKEAKRKEAFKKTIEKIKTEVPEKEENNETNKKTSFFDKLLRIL